MTIEMRQKAGGVQSAERRVLVLRWLRMLRRVLGSVRREIGVILRFAQNLPDSSSSLFNRTPPLLRELACHRRGGLLVETVVALALLGILGATVFTGVQTSSIAKGQFDEHSTAENILRNQMESILQQAYQPPLGAYQVVAAPAGYSISVETLVHEETSTDIERVRVTVFKDGQPVKTLETLRSNR